MSRLLAPSASAACSKAVDVFAPSGEYVTSIRAQAFRTAPGGGRRRRPDGFDLRDVGPVACTKATSRNTPDRLPRGRTLEPGRRSHRLRRRIVHAPCCMERQGRQHRRHLGRVRRHLLRRRSPIGKVEADQFTTDLIPGPKDPNLVPARSSPYLREMFEMFPGTECPDATHRQRGLPRRALLSREVLHTSRVEFDTDQANNDLYLVARRLKRSSATGSRRTARACRATRCTRTGLPSAKGHSRKRTFEDGRHGLEVDPSGRDLRDELRRRQNRPLRARPDAADRHHAPGGRSPTSATKKRCSAASSTPKAAKRRQIADCEVVIEAARHAAARNGNDRRRRPLQREHARTRTAARRT